jgi:FtsP/CotA-like multicopper oxidase with cupredoxin domain
MRIALFAAACQLAAACNSAPPAASAAAQPREELPMTPSLPTAIPPRTVELADGDEYELVIAPVRKRIGNDWVRLLAYNGSVPGPSLRIPQGATVKVRATNRGDSPTTVHWHGLRLDNRSDGTHATQAPIPVGGSFTYELRVPDAGAYWYHPHIREDHGQEMGLYGTIIVAPADAGTWPPAHRELAITLDDILIEDGRVAPFSPTEITHVAMGRFGNTMLVAGETDLALAARTGEVVRLYLTNTANTRLFNVALPGARMKLVGGDSGRVEHERFIDEVLLAPSERAVVDVLFERPGALELVHRTPDRAYRLARIAVAEARAEAGPAARFAELRTDAELVAERRAIRPFLAAPPAKVLAFVAEMDMPDAAGAPMGHAHHAGHHAPAKPAPRRLEWEDDMVEMNRASTPATMRWKLVDRATGKENGAIDWRFRVGDQVKIRLVNEMGSDHPMPHPFHVHGAGRFLVLARDGAAETNLGWKDTVLVKTGETVDILLDVSNPGVWMAHCHIAEHHEGGMMFGFEVAPAYGANLAPERASPARAPRRLPTASM